MENEKYAVMTRCKNCVFNNNISKDKHIKQSTQSPCKLSLIDNIYKNRYEMEYSRDDDGNCYFTILGCTCVYYRPEGWSKNTDNLEELKEKAKDELRIKVGCLILFGDDSSSEGLIESISSVNKIQYKLSPSLIVVNNSSKLRLKELSDLIEKNSKVQWRLDSNVVNYDNRSAIDASLDKFKGNFVFLGKAGYRFDPDVIQKLDSYIFNLMERCVFVSPRDGDDINGMAINIDAYKLICKRKNNEEIEKLMKKATDDEKSQYLIKSYSEVFGDKPYD